MKKRRGYSEIFIPVAIEALITHANHYKAASELGMDRRTLHAFRRKHGIGFRRLTDGVPLITRKVALDLAAILPE